LVSLSQSEIEGLERAYGEIEDVLPLTPLQEGLLFHALYDAQAADVYTVQLELGLEGALDSEALEAAVASMLARHASLRACFRHEGLGRPVQIIVPRVVPRWRRIDLSLLDEATREERLACVLAQDRAERFDVSSAPLMRFALIRLSAEQHRVVLTHHHVDHVGDATRLAARHGAGIAAHAVTAEKLRGRVAVTRAIADGERLALGAHALRARFTPGHAPGHLCFVDEAAGILKIFSLQLESAEGVDGLRCQSDVAHDRNLGIENRLDHANARRLASFDLHRMRAGLDEASGIANRLLD